ALLPFGELGEDALDCRLVADEVIVDDEGDVDALGPEGFELPDDLAGGLDARLAPKCDDDVAELALKRAAARELHAAEGILAHLEQVEARRGEARHVGTVGLLVAELVSALLPLAEEAGPGFVGLADEQDVGKLAEVVFLDGCPGTADDDERAAALQLGDDLPHPPALDHHAGEADDVGAGAALEVDRLDVLVEQGDGVS